MGPASGVDDGPGGSLESGHDLGPRGREDEALGDLPDRGTPDRLFTPISVALA